MAGYQAHGASDSNGSTLNRSSSGSKTDRASKTARAASPTRRLILNTTRELIGERGFSAMQMAEVAKRAGLATGSLYRHFRSKDELTAQVFRELATRESGLMRRIAAEDGDVEERFVSCIRTFCERALRGQRIARALLLDPLEPALSHERAALRQTQAEILSGLLQEAKSQSRIPACDCDVTSICLTGALTAALVEMDADRSQSIGDRLDSVVEFCRLGAGFGQSGTASITLSALAGSQDDQPLAFADIPDELI